MTLQPSDRTAIEWHVLLCHPRFIDHEIQQVRAGVSRHNEHLRVCYEITGNLQSIKIPELQMAERRDELWRHTCAELFIAPQQNEEYMEFNFSPASHWAAYAFSSYRQAMQPLTLQSPEITQSSRDSVLQISVDVAIPVAYRQCALHAGLTMVIEDNNGNYSYWALRHDSPQPDFHRRENWLYLL